MAYLENITEASAGFAQGTIKKYVSKVREYDVNLHSLLMMKDGKVFCEMYAPQFNENFRHRLYSVSKTFVSAAVGIAEGEGLLKLSDKVADFYPEKLPENPHKYLLDMTIEDCLKMTTVFDETPYNHLHDDWIADCFNAKATHRGGTIFHYDTGATLLLDEIVHRVTGRPFNEYLYEKALKYIGFEECPACVECPDGVKWGGSGIFATTRELAAFALLFANGGRNKDGVQLIPEDYVKKATSKQIGNYENNDLCTFHGYGYGYQIWLTKYGYAFLGMGNQLALIFPEENLILITTADDQGNPHAREIILDLFYEFFIKQLGADHERHYGATLALPPLFGEKTSVLSEKFSKKVYKIEACQSGIEKLSFDFTPGEEKMVFFARGEEKVIPFAMGDYKEGTFPEDYSGLRINTPQEKRYRCHTSAVWDMPDKLLIRCYASDTYFGQFIMNVAFCDDGIDFHFNKKAEWFFDEYTGYGTGKVIKE